MPIVLALQYLPLVQCRISWGSMSVLPEVTKLGPTHMSVARLSSLLPPAPPQRAYTHVLSGIHARSLDLNKKFFFHVTELCNANVKYPNNIK